MNCGEDIFNEVSIIPIKSKGVYLLSDVWIENANILLSLAYARIYRGVFYYITLASLKKSRTTLASVSGSSSCGQ
jgi:hypothetical protein